MFDLWLSRPVFFLGSFRRMWASSKDRSHPQQHCKPEENILQANKYLASSKQTSKQLRGRLGLPVYKFLVCSSNVNKHQPCLLSAYIFILQMIIRGNELQANGGQIVWKCLSFYRLLSLVGSPRNLFGEYLDLPPHLRLLTILVISKFYIWDKGSKAKGNTTYLCEACCITCFSDHGKSNLDQGKDDVWATVVTRVCAELSIHQIIHNCVEGFRSKQLVNCGLKWGRFWNDQNSEFLNCLFFFSPGCPSCSRHKSCQHPEVPHRCWHTSSQPGEAIHDDIGQIDSYLGVPISWPEYSCNGGPEPRKFHLTLFFIHTTSAESIDQNFLKKMTFFERHNMGWHHHMG